MADLLNKTINCNGAELARMVEKAARALFHQGKEIHIGFLISLPNSRAYTLHASSHPDVRKALKQWL